MSAFLKILGRVFAILLIAGVVSAGIYFLAANGVIGQQGGGHDFANAARAGGEQVLGAFQAGGRGEHEGAGGAFSILGILANLLKVGGITLLVVLTQKILAKLFRKPRTLQAA